MKKRRRKRRRSGGLLSRRSLLLLIGGGLGMGGIYGSTAFTSSELTRSLGADVSDDRNSLLGIETQDPIDAAGEEVTVMNVTNRFDTPLDSISVAVENAGSLAVDPGEFITPDTLASGESGTVRTTVSCSSSVTETANLLVQATGTERSVEAERSVTIDCEADSGLSVRVDDLTSIEPNYPVFYVSYDTHGSASSAEITASDQNQYGASDSATVSGERGGALLEPGWNAGAEFDIRVQAVNNGAVEEERTIITNADTENPTENDDLATSDSAIVESATIEDNTVPNHNAVQFDFTYQIATSGSFSEVGLHIVDTIGSGGVADRTRSERSGDAVSVSTDHGANNEYKLALLVFDADGVVVDSQIEFDTADGTSQ